MRIIRIENRWQPTSPSATSAAPCHTDEMDDIARVVEDAKNDIAERRRRMSLDAALDAQILGDSRAAIRRSHETLARSEGCRPGSSVGAHDGQATTVEPDLERRLHGVSGRAPRT